ncbi:MAG TPA: o-succinylbenzoate--CoA ligase [Halococcus sp.]|nr:o-succinylbenzoate--CoA ligase [Halococcus sp.]
MNDILTQCVRTSPDATALVETGGREWTYTELDRMVERTAGQLSALEIGAGDHLGLLLETRPAAVCIIHAAMRLGCVLVPLNTRLTPEELEPQVERADLAALVCEENTESTAVAVETAEMPIASVDGAERAGVTELGSVESVEFKSTSWAAGDEMLMLYTSGTTGAPKLVVLTLENLRSSAVASAFRLGVSPEDRWLNPLSVYHMGGFAPVFRAALYGTTVILHSGSFDAETTLRALSDYDCTGISLVPTMLRRLLDAGTLSDSLRFVLLGGAPASEELIERCAHRNIPVNPTYGMTETASQVATARPDEAFEHTGTVGRPLFGTDLTVLDGNGNLLEAGETGELVVSGPTVFKEYYGDSDTTAAAFSEHGFHTGDIGYRDEGNRVWVTGRLDEQISTGGELVGPSEVAAAIREHSAVQDAAVVGLSDPEWGERVGALVVTEENLAAEALENHCREYLAGFKIPRTIAFADSLPRTASGTIEREAVRERLRKRNG